MRHAACGMWHAACRMPHVACGMSHVAWALRELMSDNTTPVILSACRTPIGKYLGGLAPLTGPRLGALVAREAVRRAGVPDDQVGEVIMGNVLQGGEGQAPGRQAAIHAGLHFTTLE